MDTGSSLLKEFVRNGTLGIQVGLQSTIVLKPPKVLLHGIEGTFVVCARLLPAILSPNTVITGAVGPINLISFAYIVGATKVSRRRDSNQATPHQRCIS